MSLVVPVKISTAGTCCPALAIVDTAAQVSILADTFWAELGCSVIGAREVPLRNAQKGSNMTGKQLKEVSIRVEKQTYCWNFLVAPIQDKKILGMDFLKTWECVVDLKRNLLTVRTEIVPTYLLRDSRGEKYHVSQIAVSAKVTFPPKRAL